MKAIFYLFYFVTTLSSNIHIKVINTSIFHFAPIIKLHHVMVLSKPDFRDFVYTIDFSPIQQRSGKTLLSLFLAKSVPAEIRLRRIDVNNTSEIIKEWISMNAGKTGIQSKELSDKTVNEIQDEDLKSFIGTIRNDLRDKKMNLYNYNCQHFSKDVTVSLRLQQESKNNMKI